MSDTSTLISLYGTPMNPGQVIEHLKNFPEALGLYYKMPETHRQDFLDFCSGKTGLYLCYDVFFQKIFNPYIHRERVEHLLGALLMQEVHILDILSREGLRMSDSASLVIMDLVVRLQDGTIINLEMQRTGYDFPQKRVDCYNSDIIMRDYSRLKEKHGKQFSYHMLNPVTTIILMEHSSSRFKQFPDTYIHHGHLRFDSGLELDNLSHPIYVSLDIFHQVMQNKPVNTPLEAWLTALTTRSPARIDELIRKFPVFSDIYREVFEFRTTPEELITMYSAALAETDRSTERVMISDMQKALADSKKELADKDRALADSRNEIASLKEQIRQLQEKL
ncbi:MAG: PD-(D/E)XK nuclease family transposase [Lachnospiraceae bacterium]|nr:PD-(D/E)XK nuclease family transposase [Lachnospiraceae bacterium]